MRSWRIGVVAVVTAFLLGGVAWADAGTRAPATMMPAETLLYLSWSLDIPADDPDLLSGRRTLEAMRSLLANELDDQQAELLEPLFAAVSALPQSTGAIGLFDVTVEPTGPAVHAALVLMGPDMVERVDAAMAALMELSHSEDDVVETTVQGQTVRSYLIEDVPMTVYWGTHDGVFIMATSESAYGQVLDCLAGRSAGLARAAEFEYCQRKVGYQPAPRELNFFANVEGMVARGKELAAELMGELPESTDVCLRELGFECVRSKYCQVAVVNDQLCVHGFAHVVSPPKGGAMTGLLKLWDQRPLTDADLQIVPQDAYWAEVGNLNLAELWQELLRVCEELTPETLPMITAPIAMSQSMLGFSITDDFLPALGDTWALYDAPAHGGILMTGTVLAVEAPDEATLAAMIQQLMQFVGPLLRMADVDQQVKQLEHDGHIINYVLYGGAPVPVAPSWAFLDGHCFLALSPQTLAAALRQADPQTRTSSLLDNEQFRAARREQPNEILSVGYVDGHYFGRLLYPIVNALNVAMCSMFAAHGLEIDLHVIPPVTGYLSRVQSYVGVTSVEVDGIHYISSGNGGGLNPLAGGLFGVSFMAGVLSAVEDEYETSMEYVPSMSGQPNGLPDQDQP